PDRERSRRRGRNRRSDPGAVRPGRGWPRRRARPAIGARPDRGGQASPGGDTARRGGETRPPWPGAHGGPDRRTQPLRSRADPGAGQGERRLTLPASNPGQVAASLLTASGIPAAALGKRSEKPSSDLIRALLLRAERTTARTGSWPAARRASQTGT